MAHSRIAIVGGGLGGATLANALMKHPNISFDVFEARPSFSESGADVGLAPNALAALDCIDGNLRQMLFRAGAVQEAANKALMDGQVISVREGNLKVDRSKWLSELIKGIPEGRLHAGKKLSSIRKTDGAHPSYTLVFEDGTTHQANAVVGADGIHSHVRRLVLGDDDPGLAPAFSGCHSARCVVPAEVAFKHLGPDILDPSNREQVGVSERGQWILYWLVGNGSKCFLIASTRASENDWEPGTWRKPVTRADLEERFGPQRNALEQGVIECFDQAQDPQLWAMWQSGRARAYYNKDICIMGDAAHATTPWQASGAGMSLEDAAVLEALLGKIERPSEIETAFKVFDELRRPRTQKVVSSSQEVGMILTDAALSREEKTEALKHKWDFIHGFDMSKHVKDAVEAFEVTRGSQL